MVRFASVLTLLFSFNLFAGQFEEVSQYLDGYKFTKTSKYEALEDVGFNKVGANIKQFTSEYLQVDEPDEVVLLYLQINKRHRIEFFKQSLSLKLLSLISTPPDGVHIADATLDSGFMKLGESGVIEHGVFVVHYFSMPFGAVRFHKTVRYLVSGKEIEAILSVVPDDELPNFIPI